MKQMYLDILSYCEANIEDFGERLDRAYTLIDRWRAPLYQVDGSLHDAIWDCIEEWADENELDLEEIEADIDIDELIWTN